MRPAIEDSKLRLPVGRQQRRSRGRFCSAILAVVALTLGLSGTALIGGATPTAADTLATRPLPIGEASYAIPTGAFFVSTTGSDTNPGTQTLPFRTLGKALTAVSSTGAIVVRAGTYREKLEVYGKAVTIQNYPGEQVWLSGSDVVTGWVADGTAWRKDGWTSQFPRVDATSPNIDPAYPLAGYPDMVFVNGVALRQVASRAEVGPGVFFVDYARAELFIGVDPSGKVVEAAARSEALYLNTAHNSVVRGIGFKHYATPVSRYGAVRGYANNLLFENNAFVDNALAGLSVIGTDIRVMRNTLARNGQMGLHAHRSNGLIVQDNDIVENNAERFALGWHAGGTKITTSSGVSVTSNLVSGNIGVGVWFDETATDVTVVRNLVSANQRHGIMFELSARAIIASNVVVDSTDWGIYVLDSSDAQIWNNTLVRNRRSIQVFEGTRQSGSLDVSWNVDRITIRNNVLAEGRSTSNSLLGVDDVNKAESGQQMGVSADYDAYWRMSSTSPSYIAAWSLWPTKMGMMAALADMHAQGQEAHGLASVGGTNPFVATDGSWRLPSDSPAKGKGMPLPSSVAAAIGVQAGVAVDLGVMTPVPGSAPTAATVAAADAFDRNTTGGWGTADAGGPWTLTSGSTADYAVNGAGTIRLAAAAGRGAYLEGTSARDVDVTLRVSANTLPSGGTWGQVLSVVTRKIAPTDEYRMRLRIAPSGQMLLAATVLSGTYTEVGIGTEVATGHTYTAGSQWQMRTSVVGASPTSLKAKVWPAGQPEPAAWQLAVSDATPTLQDAGALGFFAYLSSAATNGPITLAVDDFMNSTPTTEGDTAPTTTTTMGPTTTTTVAPTTTTTMGPTTTTTVAPTTTTVAAPTEIAAPTSVVAVTRSSSRIDVNWASQPDATGFVVERTANGGSTWQVIAKPAGTSFSDTGLARRTKYGYRIQATSGGLKSPYSETAWARTKRS